MRLIITLDRFDNLLNYLIDIIIPTYIDDMSDDDIRDEFAEDIKKMTACQ